MSGNRHPRILAASFSLTLSESATIRSIDYLVGESE
jgi:hypothetical protein